MKWLNVLLITLFASLVAACSEGGENVSEGNYLTYGEDNQIDEESQQEAELKPEDELEEEVYYEDEKDLQEDDEAEAEIPQSGIHRVEAGDTLFNIAQRFGLEQWQLALWNQILLTDIVEEDGFVSGFQADIYIGQELVLENPILSRQPVNFTVEINPTTSNDALTFDLGMTAGMDFDFDVPALGFTPGISLANVRLVAATMGVTGAFEISNTLYSFGDVSQGSTLEVQNFINMGTLPTRGFVFMDGEGAERLFMFDQSMKDGDYRISEIINFNWH